MIEKDHQKMAFAQVVETSVANNSPSQDSNHPDDLFQARNLLMVELTRCLGYFKGESTDFRRSHSSEKCGQEEDKRWARSSIVDNRYKSGLLRTMLVDNRDRQSV